MVLLCVYHLTAAVVWTDIVIAVSLSAGSALLIIVTISTVLFICGCVYRSKSKYAVHSLVHLHGCLYEYVSFPFLEKEENSLRTGIQQDLKR